MTMSLALQLSDASTGQLLARFVDEQRGTMGSLEYPSTILGNADFQRAIRAWARRLGAALQSESTQRT